MNSRGILGLALFLAGAFYIAAVPMRESLADVPLQYLPETTLAASVALYNVTFIPAAEQYLVLVDGVGDIQAEAYMTTGEGVSAAAKVLAETPPVAAVAQWYVDSSRRVDARLTPR